jgi:cytoskeletal protein CcmA (bactofilin family)
VSADDLAIRRARTVKLQRMVVPEGVIIEGSLTSGSETDISGRIEGDVNVEGRLHLGPSALVTGNVRATSCLVEGLVEGKVECAQELELGRTGRLNADAMGGKEVTLAGQVFGSVMTGGVARLRATAKISGNIRARRIVIEDGAVFNGTCTMRAPAQRAESAAARPQQQELRQIQHQQQQQGREE